MKNFKILKILRVACSLIIFFMISMQFLDVYHNLPKPYYRYNAIGTMFVPSLLKMLATTSIAAGSAFFTFVILSILFGRTYCSFACPFGTLMDILRRVSQFPAKSKLLKNTKFGKFCKKNFFHLGASLIHVIFHRNRFFQLKYHLAHFRSIANLILLTYLIIKFGKIRNLAVQWVHHKQRYEFHRHIG